MKLTPLDIKKQEFTRAFRGVDPQEVQSFLQMVADQWGSLLDENGRLEQKVRDLDSKLEHYRKIEEALQEALETARDNSHKTIENAQREAQIILREARGEAEEIRKKGSQDHKRLKHDIAKVSGRRDEVIARLRAFLMSEIELLARFEGQDQLGASYVRLHPGERKQLEPRSFADDILPREIDVTSSSISSTTASDRGMYSMDASDTEEASYEEDVTVDMRRTADTSSFSSRSEDRMYADRLTDDSLEAAAKDISDDELDFIKSTIDQPTSHDATRDIFNAPGQGTNGYKRGEQGSGGSYTLNDRFSTKPEENNTRTGQHRSNMSDNSRSGASGENERPGDSWVLRSGADQHNASGFTPSSATPGSGRGFTSELFGADNEDDLSATPEEIEKIRRILNDLD